MGFHTLSIGKTGLLTSQYALSTTGNNVANAATPGYARQLVNQQAIRPIAIGNAALGLGVNIRTVSRVADNFLETQLRNATSHDAYLHQMETAYMNLEVYFHEMTDEDISTALDDYWASLEDFNDNVENTATRRQVIEKAETLADRVSTLTQQINTYRKGLNDEIVATVDKLNTLTEQIAQLNKAIVKMEYGGKSNVSANDLRDQRDLLLKELGSIVDVQCTEETNGSIIVRQGSRTLVYYDSATAIETRSVNSDDMLVDIPTWPDGSAMDLHDGGLAAKVKVRDEVLYSYKDELDTFAANFVWQTNRILSQGAGLAGYTSVTSANSAMDPSRYLDELDFGFDANGDTFKIQNGNFEIIVRDTATGGEKTVNIEIDLDRNWDPSGDRDIVLYDRDQPDAENSLVHRVQSALDTAYPGAFKVGVDSRNHFFIESASSGYEFGFGRDTSGVLAALGINCLFTGHDGSTMGVDAVLSKSPQYLQGAMATENQKAFVSGNNEGVKQLLGLQSKGLMDGGASTLDGYYLGIAGRLGVEADRVYIERIAQASVLTRMDNQREELSGVSLDEELTRMIQYQRSFQSCSKFISITDTLYETLIGM